MSLNVTGKTKLYIGMIVLVPVIILAIMGVQGESLLAFIASFFKFLKRRRNLSVPDERYRLEQSRKRERSEKGGTIKHERGKKREKPKKSLEAGTTESQEKTETGAKKKKTKAKGRKRSPKQTKEKITAAKQEEFYDLPYTRASKEIPIESIRDGVIHTTDGRYVKIVEVLPINFLHRSASEQRNIIYSYIGYLKIAPPELQIKSISKKGRYRPVY